jgi:hypothetical protein
MQPAGITAAVMADMRALLRAIIRLDSTNQYTLFLDSTGPAEATPEGCEMPCTVPPRTSQMAAPTPATFGEIRAESGTRQRDYPAKDICVAGPKHIALRRFLVKMKDDGARLTLWSDYMYGRAVVPSIHN